MTYTAELARSFGWSPAQAQPFADFMNEVNAEVSKIAFVEADDLPDWDFASAFEAGETAKAVAEQLLQYAGYWELL